MQAHEIMKKKVITVNAAKSVRFVIKKFLEYGISGMPVVNENGEIIAYISDGDIIRFIGKHKNYVIDMISFVSIIQGDDDYFGERIKRVLDLNVLEIANKKVIKVAWDEEIENIATILAQKKLKKLPVERDGILVGIISRGDVIRHSFRSLL